MIGRSIYDIYGGDTGQGIVKSFTKKKTEQITEDAVTAGLIGSKHGLNVVTKIRQSISMFLEVSPIGRGFMQFSEECG